MTLRAVSLFSGIGGSDMGLYAAAESLGIDLEVVLAVDSWAKAVEVYNANLPHPVAIVGDVKKMTRADLPPHDLIIGGPPCQPHSLAGKRLGAEDPRDCLPDWLRLTDGSPYLMENVVSRLINAPYSVKLCAADYGDVTSRKRWFYSDHLIDVIPTPGPRRIRDIRDHAEDARVLAKRCGCKAGTHGHYDDTLDTLSAHSWHGHDIRGIGKLIKLDGDFIPSITATTFHAGPLTRDFGTRFKLGLRGNSASASAFNDDEVLGSLLSNAFHANEASKLEGCRNPSLLEMARAHSIPDDWDWLNTTKTDKGKMIANCWCLGMAEAVCRAMLVAMGAAGENSRSA